MSASAGLRHERRDGIFESTRESLDAIGTPSFRARNRTDQTSDSDASNARLGLDYRPGPSLHLTGALRGASTTSQFASTSRRQGVDLVSGAQSEARRVGGVASDRLNVGLDGGIERSFAGEGHSLKLSLGASATDTDQRQTSTNLAVIPASPATYYLREKSQHQTAGNLHLDYEKPTPGSGKLKLGYELRLETDDIATSGFTDGPTPHEPPDPGRSNRFQFKRRIQGAYVTFEQPLGALTLLGGLRREVTDIDVDQVTSAVRAHAADADWYPTLHIGYRLNDANQVVGSFSRRIERPSAEAFNPFVVINGPYDQSRGNPDLKPEVTDQLELKYDYQGAQRSLELSLYDRRSRGGFGSVTTDLGGGVFLSTTTNLVGSQRTGLEFSASTPLSKTMSLTVSLDSAWIEIDPQPGGLARRGNSGMSTGGSAQLNWKMTPKDLLQLNASVDGAQIYDSSRTSGAATVNFGYRHKLDDHWSVLLVGQDINDGLETRSTFAAPGLRERSRSDPDRRTVFLSLSYAFGKTARRDPDFDYGS